MEITTKTPDLKQEINLATISIWTAFLLIGLTITIYGPTIPFLLDDYKITLGQAGLFVSFMAMGRMASVIVSGILTDILGRKPLLVLGACFLTTGLFGIGSLSWFYGGLMFAGLAGIGHGMVDTSGSAAVSELHPLNVSKYINITHMFFGIGCLLGPLISGTILSFQFSWRVVYILKALAGILIISFLSLQQFPKAQKYDKPPFAFKEMLSIVVFLLGGVIFLYSGVGHSLNTWINKYMEDISGFSTFLAASSLAFYNLGLTLGRLVCSFVTKRLGYSKTILVLSFLSFCAISLALLSSVDLIIVLGFGLTGFFFGGLFPTTIAVSCELYPHQRGTITGVLITLAAFGSMTIPVSIGFLAESLTLITSLRILILYVSVLILFALALQKQCLSK